MSHKNYEGYKKRMRIKEFDYIRGMAIIFVLLKHSFHFYDSKDVLPLMFNNLFKVGAPMFVFISGAVLFLNYRGDFSIKDFYKKRIKRIAIPYLFFSVLLLILVPQDYIPYNFLKIPQPLFQLLTGSAHPVMWFIVLISQFYIVYPLIVKVFEKFFGTRSWVSFLLLSFAIQLISMYLAYNSMPNLSGLAFAALKRTFLPYLFYFTFGMFFARSYEKIRENYCILFLASLPLFLIVSTIYFEIEIIEYPVMFIMFFLIAKKLNSRWQRFLEVVGVNSFGIYLIHGVLMVVFMTKFIQNSSVMSSLLIFVITLCSSLALSYMIAKTPFKFLLGF